MELKIFTVKDIKAEAFANPMFFRSSLEAIRAFSGAAVDPASDFHKYAEDFVLYETGIFDTLSGKIRSYPTPISVLSAAEASTKHKEYYAARAISLSAVS